MKSIFSAVTAILLQFLLLSDGSAQYLSDSTKFSQSAASLQEIYFGGIGDNAAIYHGSEYISNGQKAIGFPYYRSDSMLSGIIYYEGIIYPLERFYYNLVSDNLIIYNYDHNALISLSNEKVDSFAFPGKLFVRLHENAKDFIKEGYYEKLVSGEPGLFCRREKKLDVGSGNGDIKYIQSNTYFIKIKSIYHLVEGKKSLLKILSNHEDELKKYGRATKLNFKKDLERALVLSTIYYSQLKN